MKVRNLWVLALGGLVILLIAGFLIVANQPAILQGNPSPQINTADEQARQNLLLPAGRLAEQQAGGTWSDYFDPQALQNRSEVVSTLVWYLAIFLLGLIVYPIVRLAFVSLPDRGYPLARTSGLLLLSYLVWLAGSNRIPFNRTTIGAVLVLLILLSLALAYRQRDALRREWREKRTYFLLVEGLFLALFLFDLLIRLGNPDLWHPWKGGEKPMDFAYFNAVLKSTSFPPYDPWFAGGFLNYYYYGFVFIGVPVKLLGIVPAIAYNLILPTVFSLIAMGAFSTGWNLFHSKPSSDSREKSAEDIPLPSGQAPYEVWEEISQDLASEQSMAASDQVAVAQAPAPPQIAALGNRTGWSRAWLAGLAAALGMVVFGNLGTVRMLFQGFERLAAPEGNIETATLPTRLSWAAQGLVKVAQGASLPFRIDSWYWDPSRIIPAPNETVPITEFPFFTVLYADPHAHLWAMPMALLALAFALSMVLRQGSQIDNESPGRTAGLASWAAALILGGLAIGALRPTNTWDFPTYLVLGMLAVGYAVLKTGQKPDPAAILFFRLAATGRKIILAGAAALLLLGLALFFFQPYADWYQLGYTAVDLWKGTRTPLDAYLTHWGLFLFLIVSWMVWETFQWMAQTPLSALRRLGRYKELILVGLLVMVVCLATLIGQGVQIAWLALPLAAWAGVLLLRPGMPDAKRFAFFCVGTGMFLTLVVEVFVLRGDIARMNTVFKFYLQVWTLLSIIAGAALGWLVIEARGLRQIVRQSWLTLLIVLAFSASLYTFIAGIAKVEDRMVSTAPHTLDGMAYMQFATYDNLGTLLDLSQDYNAIRWMQENIKGSPVIVEAIQGTQYVWFSRFSIYTGLPDVTGWEWHQRQQRVAVGDPVTPRTAEVSQFYQETSPQMALQFLHQYDVKYIILGQMERGLYPGPGLDKFEAMDGVLWQKVYQENEMTIYEVIR